MPASGCVIAAIYQLHAVHIQTARFLLKPVCLLTMPVLSQPKVLDHGGWLARLLQQAAGRDPATPAVRLALTLIRASARRRAARPGGPRRWPTKDAIRQSAEPALVSGAASRIQHPRHCGIVRPESRAAHWPGDSAFTGLRFNGPAPISGASYREDHLLLP